MQPCHKGQVLCGIWCCFPCSRCLCSYPASAASAPPTFCCASGVSSCTKADPAAPTLACLLLLLLRLLPVVLHQLFRLPLPLLLLSLLFLLLLLLFYCSSCCYCSFIRKGSISIKHKVFTFTQRGRGGNSRQLLVKEKNERGGAEKNTETAANQLQNGGATAAQTAKLFWSTCVVRRRIARGQQKNKGVALWSS